MIFLFRFIAVTGAGRLGFHFTSLFTLPGPTRSDANVQVDTNKPNAQRQSGY